MSIKHSLLALLADGPRSASQLQQQFSDRTQAVWPLNIGQVTQTLARLERDGRPGHVEAPRPGPGRAGQLLGPVPVRLEVGDPDPQGGCRIP